MVRALTVAPSLRWLREKVARVHALRDMTTRNESDETSTPTLRHRAGHHLGRAAVDPFPEPGQLKLEADVLTATANSQRMARVRLYIGALVCTTSLLSVLRISQSTATLQLVAGTGPAIVITGVAALLPHRLPSACTKWATVSLSIMIALNIHTALVRWRESEGEPYTMRQLRVVPGVIASLGAAWLLR